MATQKKTADKSAYVAKDVKKTKILTSRVVIVAILLVCLVIGGFFALRMQRRPSPQNECTLVWKAELGIDVELLIGRIQKAHAKLSIADSEIRDLDVLLNDYALQYEAACKARKANLINGAAYQCRTENMAKALHSLRALKLFLDSLDRVKDPKGQASAIRQALHNFQQLAREQYKHNCTSSISVDPRRLRFQNHIPELSIQIANAGNNDFHYTIEKIPSGFYPVPTSGKVAIGDVVTVAIKRNSASASNLHPAGFYVRTNFNDQVYVALELTEQNAVPSNEGGAASTP